MILDQALFYASKGFSVFPVGAGEDKKKPLIPSWKPCQTKAADQERIRKWWKKYPAANIAIVTGKISRLMVVDVDTATGHDVLNGYLPDTIKTIVVRTPSGGWHYYFNYRPGLVNRARVLNGCDVRTDGGYVVAPGSIGANGTGYTFAPGCDFRAAGLTDMPEILFSILQGAGEPPKGDPACPYNIDSIHLSGERGGGDVVSDNKRQHLTTSDNISFEKGGRDQSLFHLANHLVKGGMPTASIYKYLAFFGSNCRPPFPEKEIQSKIQSALNRLENRDRNLTREIRDLFATTCDNITTTFVYQVTTLTTREDRKKALVVLGRLVDEGYIERVRGQNGIYRRLQTECDSIDFLDVETETSDLWLPFNLNRLVEIMPGNIILVAGEPNAGKTGLLLNVIKNNMAKHEVHYFNSEMGSAELKKRLALFPDALPSQWKFKAWERSDNFGDVIKPGKGKINVIDFLELHDNFYEISGRLAEIHKKLNGAIAVVALQKNPGSDTGLGGFRGLEKPRLYLAMSPNTLKIVKAKNWKTPENPNGLQTTFKVVHGCQFKTVREWHRAEN